jgi:hypothetical protein
VPGVVSSLLALIERFQGRGWGEVGMAREGGGEIPREVNNCLIPKYASPTPINVIEEDGLISK